MRITMLLRQGAEVNLRSQPSKEGEPSMTPLGLAACCVQEEDFDIPALCSL